MDKHFATQGIPFHSPVGPLCFQFCWRDKSTVKLHSCYLLVLSYFHISYPLGSIIFSIVKMENEHVNTFFGHPLPFDIYSAIFALLVFIGGLIGYLKAGSTPSLIAGISFAMLLAIGTYLSSVNAVNVYLLLGKLNHVPKLRV